MKRCLGLIAIALVLSFVIGGTAYAAVTQVSKQVSSDTWTLYLTSRDSTTWQPTNIAKATVTIQGTISTILPTAETGAVSTGKYIVRVVANGLQKNTQYSLIYYADPWDGTGGHEILTFKTSPSSTRRTVSTRINIDSWLPIPCETDANAATGGKLWIVPSSDYADGHMTAWNPDSYLFDTALVNIP